MFLVRMMTREGVNNDDDDVNNDDDANNGDDDVNNDDDHENNDEGRWEQTNPFIFSQSRPLLGAHTPF